MSVVNRLRAAWETPSRSGERDRAREDSPGPPSGDAMAYEHLTATMGCAH